MDPQRGLLARRVVTAAVFAIPVALYAADPTPRYFLGDSTTYLQTAFSGTIPSQRSFVYGFLVRALTRPFGAIDVLIAAQVVASVATLGLVWSALRGRLSAPAALIAIAALACEPIRLLQQRYVMAESFSSLLFVASIVAWLTYVERRQMRWLATAQIAGALAVSLRFAFLPVFVCPAILAPGLAHWRCSEGTAGIAVRTSGSLSSGLWRATVALATSVAIAVGAFGLYDVVHTRLASHNAEIFGYNGYFLLGVASPLVTPDLTDDPALRAVLTEPLQHVAIDPIFGRGWEIFYKGGLIPRVVALGPQIDNPNRVAGQLARVAIAREPLAFLRLGIQNVTAYLDPATAAHALRIERGTDLPLAGKSAAAVLKRLPNSSIPTADDTSLTQRWHAAAGPWPAVLACTPIVFAMAFAARPRRVTRESVLLFACLGAIVATAVFLAAMPVPRYFHEVPVLAALLVGEWCGGASGRVNGPRSPATNRDPDR